MKEKIINYIETLETKSLQVDDYFKQRNELYVSNQEKDKEIERLNKEYKTTCEQKNKYISTLEGSLGIAEERYLKLHSIIKEVREYIENENYKEENICMINGVKILEILDKVEE